MSTIHSLSQRLWGKQEKTIAPSYFHRSYHAICSSGNSVLQRGLITTEIQISLLYTEWSDNCNGQELRMFFLSLPPQSLPFSSTSHISLQRYYHELLSVQITWKYVYWLAYEFHLLTIYNHISISLYWTVTTITGAIQGRQVASPADIRKYSWC